MEQQLVARQIAYIVHINDILSGKFTKEDNLNPSYVRIGSKSVSRVNVIGVVIGLNNDGSFQKIVVEDGSGKISLRNFEKRVDVNIGDVIHLVGRIREFGNERYITPEIIKKNVNKKWSLVWKEFALKDDNEHGSEKVEEINLEEVKFVHSESYIDKLLESIRALDSGDGASYKEVVKNIHDEKVISNLLLQGEIFEVKPGKLKVLD